MEVLSIILILAVGLFHVQVFVMEAFLWQSPKALKTFGLTAAEAKISQPLAINQGVYNLFLSAGLFLSFFLDQPVRHHAQIFFLSCVIVAAITVGVVVNKRIMLVQGLPAVLALVIVLINNY